jgi:outer membrane protein OmpA-like peptidoglycan-associated protein
MKPVEKIFSSNRSRRVGAKLPAAIATTVGVSLLAACGGASVSPQLTDARKTVQAARASVAEQYTPEQVERADRLLRRAEAADDGSNTEQYYAYLADRQARIALAEADRFTLDQRAQAERQAYVRDLEESAIGQRQRVETQAEELSRVQEELRSVREELARSGQAVDARTERLRQQEAELARREGQLVAERQARQAAEQRANQAMQQLAQVAKVQETAENTIITLTGEVLFETDKAQLLPQSRQRLDDVASALKAQPHAEIIVEGHTDTQGSEERNRELSQERAEAVRDFLEEQGVTGRIEAVGRGESEPIADNSSPEGRALNRRVEIILPRGQTGAGAPPPPAPRTKPTR